MLMTVKHTTLVHVGYSLFNSPGKLDQKLKLAFHLQDFDDDGVLNSTDLTTYLKITSNNMLSDDEVYCNKLFRHDIS